MELESTCRHTTRRMHTFGPSLSSGKIEAKEIIEDRKQLNVSFKLDDDIIIVENWKSYNVDVSNPNSQFKQTTKKKPSCWSVCTTF